MIFELTFECETAEELIGLMRDCLKNCQRRKKDINEFPENKKSGFSDYSNCVGSWEMTIDNQHL